MIRFLKSFESEAVLFVGRAGVFLIGIILAGLSLASAVSAATFPTISSGTVLARYDAAIASTTVGSQVTTWQNQAPSSFQSTLDASPAAHQDGAGPIQLSTPAEINGLPYLRFSYALQNGLQSGVLGGGDVVPSTTTLNIFHVGRLNSAPVNENEWYDGVNSSNRKAFIYTGGAGTPALFTSAVAAAPDLDAAPVDGEFHRWATIFDGTSSDIFIDGDSQTVSGSPGSQGWAGITIGSRHADFSSNALSIDGDIAELVVVSGDLSPADFSAIQQYFDEKFFIAPAVVPVPEPSALCLLAFGSLGLIRHTRSRVKHK